MNSTFDTEYIENRSRMTSKNKDKQKIKQARLAQCNRGIFFTEDELQTIKLKKLATSSKMYLPDATVFRTTSFPRVLVPLSNDRETSVPSKILFEV